MAMPAFQKREIPSPVQAATKKLKTESEPSNAKRSAADLCTILAESTPNDILASVDTAIHVLTEIRERSTPNFIGALDPTKNIAELVTAALKEREDLSPSTMIGIVGDTGAGKSSLINALLDYEQIAPSSGLGGACTAIATEFRYREDGDKMFKAIIQYITHEEFMVEAEILANDLLAEEEISGMAEDDGKDQPKDPDTPADIAWSKISALFPDLKRGELVTGKNGQKHESVNPILESLKERALRIKEFGATDEIQTDDEEEFGQKVSFYVSSAVEDDDKSDDGLSIEDVDSDNNEVVNLEQGNVTASEKDCVNTAANNTNRSCIWPFVKAFKVYLEADILKAGVVLIDLPGQGDSNPARAKVADSYMQRVEGLCIALEAKRASDNNNGDKLLRQRIKQGLKMQGLGSVSSMCLVCTKTDDYNSFVASKESKAVRKELMPLKKLIDENQKTLKAKELEKSALMKWRIKPTKGSGVRGRGQVTSPPDNALDDNKFLEIVKSIDDLKAKAEDLEIQREFKAISFRNRNITKAFSMKLEAEGVGGKVPIFTVSSQEYQFLQGRFVGCSKRFPDDNGTQIPALRDHLKSQAIERRVHMAQTFLEFTVEPIIRQIEVLYEMDQAGLTEKLRFSGERLLQVETQRLEEALRSGKEETMRQISESVKDLIDVIADGEAKATESSKSVVGSWSTKGGEHRMAFMTFKATIGRGGVYKPQNRDINLNAQFMKNVVESVEPLRPDFIAQRCINDWSEAGVKIIDSFHNEFCGKISHSPRIQSRFTTLEKLVRNRIKCFSWGIQRDVDNRWKRKSKAILYQIDTLAKDALKDMYTQYIEMSQKGGKGIYQDIKDKIVEDILRIRPFEACTTDIKTQFDELLTELATTTEEIISKTITDIRKGFGLILKQGEEKIDPKKFAKARKTLGTMLDNTRAILEKTIAVGDTDISDEPEGEQEVEGDGKDEEDEGMEKLTDTISGETPMAMAVDTASSSMVRAE